MSLFGSSTQPAKNPLFGVGVDTSTNNPPQQQSSLFGTSQSNSQVYTGSTSCRIANTNTRGPNLSGANTSQAQSSGLFSNTTNQASNSILGNTASGQPSQGQGGQQRQDNAPRPAMFEDLLERGRKRRGAPQNGHSSPGQLPTLQLGLGDISNKIKGLNGAGNLSKAAPAGDTRAQYLLAASGVPRGATRRDLDAFASQTGVSSAAPSAAYDTDIETYVNGLHAKTTRELMAEAQEQSKRDFNAFLEDHIDFNMEQQRRRVYEYFGIKRSDVIDAAVEGPAARGAFGKSSKRSLRPGASERGGAGFSSGTSAMNKSVLGGSLQRGSSRTTLFTDVAEKTASAGLQSALEDPYQRNKQDKYATKVRDLVSARKAKVVFPIIEQFGRVETEAGNDTPKHLIDAYRALKEIVKENPEARQPSDSGAVKERQYAKQYLDLNTSSGQSVAMRQQIIDGSRKFLEDSFFQQVASMVDRNPQEANLGGLPTKISKVRGYIRIRSARKDLGADSVELQMLGDDFCWALIFYLLRCGLVKEAASYVEQNERAIKSMDRHFPQYMASYARDRTLPRNLQVRMNAEYLQRSKLSPENSIDPYRMGCYKIIGRCELSKKSLENINAGIDDLIWLYFCLAREANRAEESAGEVCGLEEVRGIVEDIGQRHFAPGTEGGPGYATFFLMQILAGMFEQAIAYLYPHNYVAAVHFAIALDFYGLLRVAAFDVSESELLTFSTRQQPQISFARLIGYYTRDFRKARAEAAADYLILICLNADLDGQAGRLQAQVCHEALKELVLETREFALLLGDIRSDGKRVPGAIEQRISLLGVSSSEADEFLRILTTQAAGMADDAGRTTDAVLLYHLAEEYEKVVDIVNRALSDALAVDINDEPTTLQPLKPRTKDPSQRQDPAGSPTSNTTGGSATADEASTLSLTAITSPVVLARTLIPLYTSHSQFFRRIPSDTLATSHALLRIASIRDMLRAGHHSDALAAIESLELLPLSAGGNISAVRSAAQHLNTLPPVLARNVGNLLVWTVGACGAQRKALKEGGWDVSGRGAAEERLRTAARDCMVFAGLVRYKLPPDVFDVLARAGQEGDV